MVRLARCSAMLLTMFALAGFTLASPAAAQSWQCVTFARAFSGIQLFGNAATWWQQAVGRYEEGFVPRVGGVMVFRPFARMRVGHVATVSEVVGPREIRVTHANWSPVAGRRGQVEENVAVVDTSVAGDWSRVRVWYGPQGDLGRTDYPVYGFIYGQAASAVERVTTAAAVTTAQAAAAAVTTAQAATVAAAATARAIAALAALPDELAGL